MPNIEEIPQRFSNSIPYFFYDLVGRIFPGFVLSGGVLFALYGTGFVDHIKKAGTTELLFGGVASVPACFIIGYLVDGVGGWFFHFASLRPRLNLSELNEEYGTLAGDSSPLEAAFQDYFGFPLKLPNLPHENKYLGYCARLCRLVVSASDWGLDAQIARIDTEELLGRSLTVASFILALVNLMLHHWYSLAFYVLVFGISLRSHLYYRKKVIRERIQSFFVIWCKHRWTQGDRAPQDSLR